MTEQEWNIIKNAVFSKQPARAPAFLWTRILARIEAEEGRYISSWWSQWAWMARFTVAVGIMVTLGAFFVLKDAELPLEPAILEGHSAQHQAIQIAKAVETDPDTVTDWVLEAES